MRLDFYRLAPGEDGHIAGRKLLEQMYTDKTGKPLPPITVTARGKPCFSEGGMFFSISHTGKHVFCALSERPVGVDAEEADRAIDLRLAQKILSASEQHRYAAEPDKRLALLRFWVLKEAAAKCSGMGLTGYPNHTDFSPNDPRIQQISSCLVAVIEEEHHAV